MGDKDTQDAIAELTWKVDHLCLMIDKVAQYADSDPEICLMQARKSAEAICDHVFSEEIGTPGQITLETLIQSLSADDGRQWTVITSHFGHRIRRVVDSQSEN